MFGKSVWIPILIAGLFVMGCGLFYGRKVANQEPIKIYKPVDVKKKPKPPPPGETHESGHWKPGDIWHSEPHETHAAAPPAHPSISVAAAAVREQFIGVSVAAAAVREQFVCGAAVIVKQFIGEQFEFK